MACTLPRCVRFQLFERHDIIYAKLTKRMGKQGGEKRQTKERNIHLERVSTLVKRWPAVSDNRGRSMCRNDVNPWGNRVHRETPEAQ